MTPQDSLSQTKQITQNTDITECISNSIETEYNTGIPVIELDWYQDEGGE